MSKLQEYIDQFGAETGRRLYHIYRSRAAYKGVSTKRRQLIEELTGKRFRDRTRSKLDEHDDQMLLPLGPSETNGPESLN